MTTEDYLVCECGGTVIEVSERISDTLPYAWIEYCPTDTCYECAVVSSD